MPRALMVGTLLLLGVVSSALAWNKAGHMVSGAIAYADLKQASPQTLARVVALLKTHPHFETKWAPRLQQPGLSPEEQDLYLFMLAARWPDDIRGDPAFHLTFRTLFRTSEAILEEPPVEGGGGAIYRLFHAP